jgi:two-component system phosphate regulon sensor histidine kinase PhoR
MFALAAGIVSVPTIALLVCVLIGWVSLWPTAGLIAITWLTGAAVASIISRDIRILSQVARRLAADDTPSVATEAAGPIIMEALGRDLDHLSRRAADRIALVEQLRRADSLILERLPDPLIVLAADRSVRRANSAARTAFGEDIGAVLRHPDLGSAINRTFTSGLVQTAQLSLPVPVERDVQASVVPMDPPLADGGRAIVVLSDRTRERMVERMRADFVANVSHELRTPLASLIGFIETLRGPAADDPPAQQRFLAIMAGQGARMNRLIDDLLSLSRIELTEHQTPSESVDLREVTRGLVAGFEPRLVKRKVQFEIHVSDDLPQVTGDADQIAQVVQNLLDNALKYGRDGGVVRLTVVRAPTGTRWPARAGVVVTVTDQGAGIPREQIPRLTERFYRVDKGRSRSVGGTGLGLAIVKHIVNRHRGQLFIESEVGAGTTVSVWLPLTQPATRGVEYGTPP